MDTTKCADGNRRKTLLTKAIAVMLAVVYAAVPVRVAADVQASGRLAIARAAGAYQKAPADQAGSEEGELLFASGSADLNPGAMGELNKLVDFLGRNPDRSVAIRGYTDGVGNEAFNQRLSERRANSAKAYLVARGIESTRLSSLGMGQSAPLAANDSAAGRQQNRRVEVTISNPPGEFPLRARSVQVFVLLVLLESTRGSLGTFFR
jgi:outer membrane protein OmpA-like peptidoglycan-associated protein